MSVPPEKYALRSAAFEIFIRDGKIWRKEFSGDSMPTVRLTRDALQVGCTKVTRDAFELLMKEAKAFWQEDEKIIQ